jgi:hypothetical protein
MKKKIIYTSALFIALSFTAISQGEKSNTIVSQFNDLIENSNSYKEFKVIKKRDLGTIQQNIQDSIVSLKKTIASSKSLILKQKNNIDSTTNQIGALKNDLEVTQKKVDNIEILGFPTHKTYYNMIMWSTIIALLFLSIIMFFVFKKGRSNTKIAKEKLTSTETELDSLRKRSLEKEQIIRRELQDEINKNSMR